MLQPPRAPIGHSLLTAAVIGAVALAIFAAPDRAAAQGQARVAVVSVDGPQARKIRGYIETALRREVELVDAGDSTPTSDSGFADLARQLNVQALITARVEKSRRFVVTVSVRQGRDGSLIGSSTWAEKKAPKLSVVQRELWSKLQEAIESAEGPATEAAATPVATPATAAAIPTLAAAQEEEEEEDPADESDEDDEPSAETDDSSAPSGERRPAVRFDLGAGPMWRDQAYNQSAGGAPLRYFNEAGSPAMWLEFSAAWYPVALVSDSMLGNIGIVGGFGTALGLSSEDEAGTSYDTSATTFHLGLRGRLPIGRSEVGLTLAFGGRNFSTDIPAAAALSIPDVSYRFLRIAADGHIAISGAFGVELNAGYLARLSSGQLEEDDYFPELSGGGIEFGLAAVLALGDTGLSLRAALDWQRFFFSFNVPDDAVRLVGGAVDNYYTFTLGARYELTTK